jgi:hypothetical protein
MGGGRCEVGSERLEVGGGRWEVGGARWEVGGVFKQTHVFMDMFNLCLFISGYETLLYESPRWKPG